MTEEEINQLKNLWIDQFVEVVPGKPELARFEGKAGRVVTVNCNGNAIIDFQDGAWYDVPASTLFLNLLGHDEGQKRYNDKINSAQPFPSRQG